MLRLSSVNVEHVKFKSIQVRESFVASFMVASKGFRCIRINLNVEPHVKSKRFRADEAVRANVALESIGICVAQLVLPPVACVVKRFLAELADVRLYHQVNVLVVVKFGYIEERSLAAGLFTSERPVIGMMNLNVSLHQAWIDQLRALIADNFLSDNSAAVARSSRWLSMSQQMFSQRLAEEEMLAT